MYKPLLMQHLVTEAKQVISPNTWTWWALVHHQCNSIRDKIIVYCNKKCGNSHSKQTVSLLSVVTCFKMVTQTCKLESRIINTILEKAIKDKSVKLSSMRLILNLSLLAAIVTSTFLDFTVPEPSSTTPRWRISLQSKYWKETQIIPEHKEWSGLNRTDRCGCGLAQRDRFLVKVNLAT